MDSALEGNNIVSGHILIAELRDGQKWLIAQHNLWLVGDAVAADDDFFSRCLAAWEEAEKLLRCSGYNRCIWEDGECPTVSPVICDACCHGTQQRFPL